MIPATGRPWKTFSEKSLLMICGERRCNTILKGGGILEFIRIVVDFIVLSAIGFFCTTTLIVWYIFCDAFVFNQGYLSWLVKKPAVKALVIILSGILIWGAALMTIHKELWTEDNIPVEQEQGRLQ